MCPTPPHTGDPRLWPRATVVAMAATGRRAASQASRRPSVLALPCAHWDGRYALVSPRLALISVPSLVLSAPCRWGDNSTVAAVEPVAAEGVVTSEVRDGVGESTDTTGATSGADGDASPEDTARALQTTAATLLRSTSVLGCWVYIASSISRLLGPAAIAAHGVVLKVRSPQPLAPSHPSRVHNLTHISPLDLPRISLGSSCLPICLPSASLLTFDFDFALPSP